MKFVWKEKGSFTIEAAFLMPMLFFLLAGAAEQGISIYEEGIEEAEEFGKEEKYWGVKDFYKYQQIEEVRGNEP